MQTNTAFLGQDPEFWSYVRYIGQRLGYSKKNQILVPTENEVRTKMAEDGIDTSWFFDEVMADGVTMGDKVMQYLESRREIIAGVEGNLLDAAQAEEMFNEQRRRFPHVTVPFPMNKQKKAMKKVAFLTATANILIAAHLGEYTANFDPQKMVSYTAGNRLKATMARRVDGVFPSIWNPLAVWEIKEYYYTTTFGSRIADGVYETLLDGYELKEIRTATMKPIFHYLIIDGKYTWWTKGQSYLCRMVDMMHMGLVTEVLVGSEIIERIPVIVEEWKSNHQRLNGN